MSCLAPCPACNRHVATDDTTCPFCSFRWRCLILFGVSLRASRFAGV